jgi:branched-chain amino acid transport system permease protein
VLGSIFLVLFDELLRPIGQLNTFVVSGVALLVILFWPDGVLGYVLRPREGR